MQTQMRGMTTILSNAWGPGKTMQSIRTISYWCLTFVVAYEMMAGGIWDLMRIEYVRVVMAHLGYPMYLLTIIGAWKMPCAMVLLLPRFLRLKEWAYAGALFDYTGAAASHFFVGDGAGKWAIPLVLGGFTLASALLRSPERRLAGPAPLTDKRIAIWLVPSLVLILLFVLAFISLPKGPPPA